MSEKTEVELPWPFNLDAKWTLQVVKEVLGEFPEWLRGAIYRRIGEKIIEANIPRKQYDELRGDRDRLLTVAEKAKWLVELVHRDAVRDGADAQCLQNHGLVWKELDEALTAVAMQPRLDRSPLGGDHG